MEHTPADLRVAAALGRRRRRGRWLRGGLLFVSCVLLLDALVGERGLRDTMRAREESGRLAESLGQMESENAGLREHARRLREDPATIESVAREDLGLIRPGEILIVIRTLK